MEFVTNTLLLKTNKALCMAALAIFTLTATPASAGTCTCTAEAGYTYTPYDGATGKYCKHSACCTKPNCTYTPRLVPLIEIEHEGTEVAQ